MKLLEDLFVAYYDARRHKRNTNNQLDFEIELEKNLMALHDELADRTWRPGRSVAFIINKPVKREVFAASFADRVVHHLLFNYVNEIFERSFINDSYSCRKGKGTSYGIDRIDHHMRSCSHNYTRDAWVMKLDMSGYFMSINRYKLYEKVTATLLKYAGRKNQNEVRFVDALDYNLIMYLVKHLTLYDPLENCLVKGRCGEWEGLPRDKSLFGTPQGCGLPIGNLTSQLFSNVYLNDFDHWVVFLGAILKPHRRYAGQRTIKNFIYCCRSAVAELQARVNSYLGLMLHYKTFGLRKKYSSIIVSDTAQRLRFLSRIFVPVRTQCVFHGNVAILRILSAASNSIFLVTFVR